jgi:hypothetical protein
LSFLSTHVMKYKLAYLGKKALIGVSAEDDKQVSG